jgi:hypothetical protein
LAPTQRPQLPAYREATTKVSLMAPSLTDVVFMSYEAPVNRPIV